MPINVVYYYHNTPDYMYYIVTLLAFVTGSFTMYVIKHICSSQKNIPTKNIPQKNIPTKSIPQINIPTKSIPQINIPTKSIPQENIPNVNVSTVEKSMSERSMFSSEIRKRAWVYLVKVKVKVPKLEGSLSGSLHDMLREYILSHRKEIYDDEYNDSHRWIIEKLREGGLIKEPRDIRKILKYVHPDKCEKDDGVLCKALLHIMNILRFKNE